VNANTNSHSRAIIHRAKTSNIALAQRFSVSTKTKLIKMDLMVLKDFPERLSTN
jgi:hypothetical protein